MCRRFFPALLLACVFLALRGTLAHSADLSCGLKGEFLFTGFTGNHSSLNGFSGRDGNGLALGGFVRMSWKEVLAVHTDLLFVYKTDHYKNSATGEALNLGYLYLEMPVLINVLFSIPVRNRIVARLFGGPYTGLLLHTSRDARESGITLKPFDFGIVVGMGIDVQSLQFEFSHSVGLVPLSEGLEFDTHAVTIGVRIGKR